MKYLLLLYLFSAQLLAVGEAGAIFLLIAPGAGPQGSGEAQVAKADDAYASYYNPAGLGFLKGAEAAGMHVNWLPNLASDLYYEFMTYRHHIDGLGSIGGHLIYLNLGEQIGMDEFGNPTDNWKSYMGAVSGSFGTLLSESSSIGFNFKVFHQKLSDQVVAGEKGKGFSTDFAFDIGYLKKFKQNQNNIKSKKQKKINKIFIEVEDLYEIQYDLNDVMLKIIDGDLDSYEFIEKQGFVIEDLEKIKEQFNKYSQLDIYTDIDEKITTSILEMNDLIDYFSEMEMEEILPSMMENIEEFPINKMDIILFNLLEIKNLNQELLVQVENQNFEILDDKFNFGFSISNIGPKIDFVDVDQADPSPTNMRLGIFAQLYNDGYNKINFLFDANKLLVTRYPMMDWDGDGMVGGYSDSGFLGGDYNIDGDKEYDSKGYIDDPWYLALVTAWMDDWLLGGDIDYPVNAVHDQRIGGYGCTNNGEIIEKSLNTFECEGGDWSPTYDLEGNFLEFSDPEYGIYGAPDSQGRVKKEKGSGKDRSIKQEFEEMIYNVGLEYWYTDAFALRTGYIYDLEGKVFNPTFGAGIRLLQYGFDFGYTAGGQGHPRANTMFFSINIEI